MKTNSQTSSRLSIQREAANCRQKPEPLLPSGWSASKRFFPARGEWSSLFVISPFRDERDMARSLFEPDDFLEVFVDTPLAVAEERDPKGLYKKARSGNLPNFTGIDSEYQSPINPNLILKTEDQTAAESAKILVEVISNYV